MSRMVQLLGRPSIDGPPGGYRMRSRKSWALLAYLLISERPPSRAQLSALLFEKADDPLGALRWSLAEIRRALGAGTAVGGDPVMVSLPRATLVDIEVLTGRSWTEAVRLPSLGGTFLEGVTLHDAAAFESWLLSQQYRFDAATEEILHEAALGSLSRGALDEAIDYAVRLLTLTPLDENHQALLIRLYRMNGQDDAAERQFRDCAHLLQRELGVSPGPIVRAAMREPRGDEDGPTDVASVRAALESGIAAVSAGAVQTGTDSLRSAVRSADRVNDAGLRITCRLVLAETLVHSLRGFDEEGSAALQAANDIALSAGDRRAVAESRAELGYVDFLRGRYDRSGMLLSEAIAYADGLLPVTAKATTYLGCVASDRAQYAAAFALLEEGVRMSLSAGDRRRAAFGLAMLGRACLLSGDLDEAATRLDEALAQASEDHWLAFMPWPQALRGEVEFARGHREDARALLDQAFARACRLGDPCWEGMAARGLALIRDADGDTAAAFSVLADARRRANRLADPYVWLDGYILDAQCTLGRRHDHPDTPVWAAALNELASRSGMRELLVRALVHQAALGRSGDEEAARLLAADIDNPLLGRLLPAV